MGLLGAYMSEGGRKRVGNSYQDLIAWQKAMVLINQIYELTDTWPAHEQFALRNQIQRAVVSIAANIAEGQGRNGRKEFTHHLGIAFGSLGEVETIILVGRGQQYHGQVETDHALTLCGDVGRLIKGLLRSLREDRLRSKSRRG